jgi:iron complex outermembrane receptor protein
MAGHRGLNAKKSSVLRLAWALCLVVHVIGTSWADARTVYDIDLYEQRLADALTALSEQTGVPVVFPYDLVKDRSAHPVTGRYTVLEALDALLRDTGLSGGLSAKGVLTVSAAKPNAPNTGETFVTRDQQEKSNKQNASKPAGAVAFFASIVAAFTTHAQSADRESGPLQEVLVSAQKRGEERLQDVPVPVSVLPSDTLASENRLSLTDYATSVPGFVVAPVGVGEQQLAIRGITTSGFTLPTVAVTIDGVPYGGLIDVPDIDPGDLARIEVLRGPQGTLYGASSMGGLVNFITKDPSLMGYSGSLQMGTNVIRNGSGAGYNLRGSANLPVNDITALRVSGYSYTTPGYLDNPVRNLQGVNRTDAYGGRATLLFQPLEAVSIRFSALYDHIDRRGSNEVDVPTAGFSQTLGLGDLQQNYMPGVGGQRTEIQAYSLTLNADLGPVKLVSLSGYNNVYDPSSYDATDFFGADAQKHFGVNGSASYAFTHYKKFTEELRLSGSLGGRFDWLAGGFYSHTKLYGFQDIAANDPATGRYVGADFLIIYPRTYEEVAGFVNLTYHFTDRFDVQFGGRESQDQERDAPETLAGPFIGPTPSVSPAFSSKENAFTYLVTPRLKLSRDLMVYARFASGFRPGGPNQHGEGIPPAYQPDKTQNYELGAKGDLFDNALSIDASLYYIKWKDIQIQENSAQTLAFTSNGSGAKSEGVEVSFTLRPTKGLSISGWYAYDNAVLTQAFPANSPFRGLPGDRLPLSSRNSGSLTAEYDFALTDSASAFLGATERFVGDRVGVFTSTAQRQALPGYQLTDLRAGVKQGSWTTTLYVNNLLDRRGVVNGGAGYLLPYAFFYTMPRTVGLTVAKTF